MHHRLEKFSGDENKFLDIMKAAGEDNNAKIIAEVFNKLGFSAKSILIQVDAGLLLSDEFGNAEVLNESFINLSNLKKYNELIIFQALLEKRLMVS